MSRALDGIRVLECGIWQQGPSTGRLLADFGAEVIKIEATEGGDPARGLRRVAGNDLSLPGGRNCYFETLNRNKKSLAIDLKQQSGRDVLFRLVEHSDVFLQNLRGGAVQRLGIDYPAMSARNPKLIYASLGGFGEAGPDSRAPAMDYVGQARGGVMMMASPDGVSPDHLPHGSLDELGAMTGTMGILLALLARERHGFGQEVSTSLLSTAMAIQIVNLGNYLLKGVSEVKCLRTEVSNPLINHYRASDGAWLAMHVNQANRYWPGICRALEVEHLCDDPRFADMDTRERNKRELIEMLDCVFATRPRSEWLARLKAEDVIVGAVNSLPEVVEDPQVVANEYVVDFQHPVLGTLKSPGPLVRLSKTPGSLREAAPDHGQHTEEVLEHVAGYSWDEILRLKETGVVV